MKHVFHISREKTLATANQKNTDNIPETLNTELSDMIRHQKDIISFYHNNKKWDKYKKFANEYELIFTSGLGHPSISSVMPISRSFFKLWEMLHDFEEELGLPPNKPLTCAFLAEGPGGFIEAFSKYRKHGNDKIYGMTLISSNKSVPSWRLPNTVNAKLLFGADGTGSLYSKENIKDLVKCVGPSSCDLITADGGFDFSSDFNSQENTSMKLIYAEVDAAMLLQKPGGSFVLKIYDIFMSQSIDLIYRLSLSYEHVYITKPLSSRPANSEKYLVCTGFIGGYNAKPLQIPTDFMYDIVEYNAYYVLKQITQISRTIQMISTGNTGLKRQVELAIRWCHKYDIPINIQAISFYKMLLSAKSAKCQN